MRHDQRARAQMYHGMVGIEGEKPVRCACDDLRNVCFQRVALPGTAAQIGRYIASEASYALESDSEQVP